MSTDRPSKPAAAAPDHHFRVELSRSELALVIGALLQAEATLPLIDGRYARMKCLAGLRRQQLSLADRLEDMMADVQQPHVTNGAGAQMTNGADVQNWQDGAGQATASSTRP